MRRSCGLRRRHGRLVYRRRQHPVRRLDALLYAIAAAVIGGTSLFGGHGSVWSAILGWLVIGSIYNGMFLLNLSADFQSMMIGAVLIVAVVIDAASRRSQLRGEDCEEGGSAAAGADGGGSAARGGT